VTYSVLFLALRFVLGRPAVASNLSLLWIGWFGTSVCYGCGWWLSLGVSFASLVFMVYLGGM
ncbi:NU6M oxidoreductase, partial [Sula dactylatra]|nr:NU6M oxidoreductase [Sula dactylatra]